MEKIYNSALDALLDDDYVLAVTEFEQVEAQYPVFGMGHAGTVAGRVRATT